MAVGILMLYFHKINRETVEAGEKYRLIVENQNDLILKFDSRLRILYASPSYCRTFGKTEKELAGQNFMRLIHETDRAAVKTSLEQLADNPHTAYHEERAKTIHGVSWLAWSVRAIVEKSGDIQKIIAVGRDITEQKKAEKALRQSEAHMRSVFRCAPTGIGVVVNRVFKQVNEKLCAMTGYGEKELIGQDSRMVYPSRAVYERVGREKYDQIEKFGTGLVDTQFRCKDGSIIDVMLSSTPIDANHAETGVTFTALDITAIKKTDAALRKSEKRYRTMMEAIQDPVYIGSMDYRIEYMNPALIEKLGRDATGERCYEALHGLDEHCPWCQHRKIVTEGHVEKEILSPRDNRAYSVSSSVFTNEDGSFSKITVMRDTTDFKRLQNQLQQAQKMEAIGNLAGGIAHDFNNILFPIIGLSEMLLEDIDPKGQEYESVQEILAAAKRGGDLVKQILAFSRQSEKKRIPVRLQPILKEVLKLSRATIPADIRLESDIDPNCGRVMADPTQVHQIAMNLITNAYHAVEETSGTITVGLEAVSVASDAYPDKLLEEGEYALLRVSDDGCGIDPAAIDKIFEPYFTTKGKAKGTGLGLSVVYGIVREYHGDILVSSTPGQGARFDIYLPLKASFDTILPAKAAAVDRGGSEHILLVDDEVSVVGMVEKMLARLGYRVTSRTSSVEALSAFTANPKTFDLVVSDMTMPNMTGDQMVQAMMAVRPDIPVIICTGFSDRINHERAKAIGIQGFLMKPVVKSEMAAMVRDVLDGAPA